MFAGVELCLGPTFDWDLELTATVPLLRTNLGIAFWAVLNGTWRTVAMSEGMSPSGSYLWRDLGDCLEVVPVEVMETWCPIWRPHGLVCFGTNSMKYAKGWRH